MHWRRIDSWAADVYQNRIKSWTLEYALGCYFVGICWDLKFYRNSGMTTGGLILLWVAAAFVQTYGKTMYANTALWCHWWVTYVEWDVVIRHHHKTPNYMVYVCYSPVAVTSLHFIALKDSERRAEPNRRNSFGAKAVESLAHSAF